MQITRLVRTKQNPQRVSVWIDGQFAFACHIDLVFQHGWKSGDEITQALIDEVNQSDERIKIRARILDLLSRRPYSSRELRQHLLRPHPKRQALPPDVVDAVLQQLQEDGLVDDQAFAEFWVEQRDTFRPRSSRVLHAELRSKGIADDTIEEHVHAEQDAVRALSVARHTAERLARQPGMSWMVFREKLGAFLLRRGFSYSQSKDAVLKLWQELHSEQGDEAHEGEDFSIDDLM